MASTPRTDPLAGDEQADDDVADDGGPFHHGHVADRGEVVTAESRRQKGPPAAMFMSATT
jgi:hypothetical protein